MMYLDYVWHLTPNTMVPDIEINTDRLEWKVGDYWQIQERNGQLVFCKVDPMVQFLLEGTTDGRG